MSSDVLVVEQGSVGWHLGFDLESDTVSEWISWERNTLLVNEPSVSLSGIAWVEGNMVFVSVFRFLDLQADASIVSEVLSFTWEVRESLVVFVGPLSDDSGESWSVLVVSLVRDGVVSLAPGSDRSGS